MKSPCYLCSERHTACWGSCGKYADFRAELDRVQAIKRKEHDINDYEKLTAARMRRRAHNRRAGGYDQ